MVGPGTTKPRVLGGAGASCAVDVLDYSLPPASAPPRRVPPTSTPTAGAGCTTAPPFGIATRWDSMGRVNMEDSLRFVSVDTLFLHSVPRSCKQFSHFFFNSPCYGEARLFRNRSNGRRAGESNAYAAAHPGFRPRSGPLPGALQDLEEGSGVEPRGPAPSIRLPSGGRPTAASPSMGLSKMARRERIELSDGRVWCPARCPQLRRRSGTSAPAPPLSEGGGPEPDSYVGAASREGGDQGEIRTHKGDKLQRGLSPPRPTIAPPGHSKWWLRPESNGRLLSFSQALLHLSYGATGGRRESRTPDRSGPNPRSTRPPGHPGNTFHMGLSGRSRAHSAQSHGPGGPVRRDLSTLVSRAGLEPARRVRGPGFSDRDVSLVPSPGHRTCAHHPQGLPHRSKQRAQVTYSSPAMSESESRKPLEAFARRGSQST